MSDENVLKAHPEWEGLHRDLMDTVALAKAVTHHATQEIGPPHGGTPDLTADERQSTFDRVLEHLLQVRHSTYMSLDDGDDDAQG
jgi:hypothetical protein